MPRPRSDLLHTTTREELDRLAEQGELVTAFRELRYDEGTPVGVFLRLAGEKHAVLLESAEGGERWGRWSFLGFGPRRTLLQRGREVTLREGRRARMTTEVRPLDVLRALVGDRRLARDPRLPPFVGGWVGYLGWGAVSWFEPRVPQRHGPDPDFPDAEWMELDRVIAFDHVRRVVQLIAVIEPRAWRSGAAAHREALRRLDGLERVLSAAPPRARPYRPPVRARARDDGEGFKAAVARVREYIAAGDCMQVVVSRRVEARYPGDPFELYRRIRHHTPAPYLFHLRMGERTLIGASPEVLLRVADGRVSVRPIAGTRRRGRTPAEDLAIEQELRADPKERAEHVMLLDLGRNDVGRVSKPGSVVVEAREVIERYSHVMHLVSQVSGELREGLDGFDAVASVFPAGTVSGAPKVRAMEIIDELEPMARGPYAGAVGYVGYDGVIDLAITIRSLALAGARLRFQAGAGIVHDSSPERELEETEEKMRGLLSALGVAAP